MHCCVQITLYTDCKMNTEMDANQQNLSSTQQFNTAYHNRSMANQLTHNTPEYSRHYFFNCYWCDSYGQARPCRCILYSLHITLMQSNTLNLQSKQRLGLESYDLIWFDLICFCRPSIFVSNLRVAVKQVILFTERKLALKYKHSQASPATCQPDYD